MSNVNNAIIYYQTSPSDTKFQGKIPVTFNPATYTVSRTVSYGGNQNDNGTQLQQKNYPVLNYTGGNNDTLSLELMFNKYEFQHYSNQVKYTSKDLSIIKEVKEIEALTLVKDNLHRPPLCKFIWSSFAFEGYVTSFNADYTMFLDDGTPVRAKVKLTIRGAELGNDAKIPFQSPNRTKSRTLQEGQQLWEIAYEEYENPEMWREIAKANGIRNPLNIKSGMQLVIPALKR